MLKKVATVLKQSRRFSGSGKHLRVMLFPGQASHFVGMGRGLVDSGAFSHTAEKLFEEARAILGYNLKATCVYGPQEQLDDAACCQAAVFVCSYVRAKKFEKEYPDIWATCRVLAGFSAGEITALAIAGVLSFADACALIRERGLAMKRASETGMSSGLASVVGKAEAIETAIADINNKLKERNAMTNSYCDRSLYVAHDLHPQGKNVGGDLHALEELKKVQVRYGLRGFRLLRVAGAFHTPYMQPGVDHFSEYLSKIPLKVPDDHVVYSNVTAKPHDFTKPDVVKQNLVRHLVQRVCWDAVISDCMTRHPVEFYECGAGQSLSTILKRQVGTNIVVHHLGV